MRDERHPLDPISLTFGLVFVVLALAGLSNVLLRTDPVMLQWLVPAALIVIGIGVLATSLRRERTRADEDARPGEAPGGDANDGAGSVATAEQGEPTADAAESAGPPSER